jgi:hypothetical protein
MSMRKGTRAAAGKSVGAGLHLGRVELQSDGAYVVRLTSGVRVTARLDPEIPASFVDECMQAGRSLLLADDSRGALIVGALDRPGDRQHGAVAVRGGTVQIQADKNLKLQVGKHCLTLDASGVVRLNSKEFVVDAASLVRFLTAKVELP